MTGMDTDNEGDGCGKADGFHGSPRLNARHVTLVAAAASSVHTAAREMNACSSSPLLPPGGRRRVTKPAIVARSDAQNSGFFRFAAGDCRAVFESRRATPSRFLKNSLTACSVLRRGKCCASATSGAKCHRITTRLRPLARVLHCNVKSLACPIDPSADCDSRTEAVPLRNWNPIGAYGIYR